MNLPEGIYERLITESVGQNITELKNKNYFIGQRIVSKEEAANILSAYIAKVLNYALKEIKGEDQITKQIEICNSIVKYLSERLQRDLNEDLISTEGKILSYILSKVGKTDTQINDLVKNTYPQNGLTLSSLFTGSNSDISIDTEIEKDILSADRILWIVSFIRWSGLRIFEKALKSFIAKANAEFRIITTTYLGASEPKALEFLATLPNTKIKISYLTHIERLHAKSYYFERLTGFDTAYIGSSNLSKSALTKGLEWNIRVTASENPHIIEKAKATFEHYWNSADFEIFTSNDIGRFEQAIQHERNPNSISIFNTSVSLSPFPFQKEILEKLTVEREIHSRYKNLIVAATGTGKTVIAAFDFKRLYNQKQGNCKLLFIAHRKEILEQARATFRSVLKDYNFGQLWVGNHNPANGSLHHLFISVQTFHSHSADILERCPSDFFDFIVIDEAHHSQANTYRQIFEKYTPKILLGLTATPERMDGISLLPDFDHTIAAEIRLPDALGMKLLSPFQYFCITDESVDLRNVNWSAGKYDASELTNVLCIDARARLIVDAINHYLTDIYRCKAICFCSSQAHAKFMCDALRLAGFRAEYLIGSASIEDRTRIRQELAQGMVNFVCVVDIYNEGIDIPEIDTVLFLRPTESLTIFLQQLGRGLRLSPEKDCLTVLDFVSQAHERYNYAEKFRALVGKSDQNIRHEIESSFPHLPAGCSIRMERQAKEYILNNIRYAIFNKDRLRREIAAFRDHSIEPLTIGNFARHHNLDIRTLYRGNQCWTWLKKDAGVISIKEDQHFKTIAAGIRRLVLIDSPVYLHFIQDLTRNQFEISDKSEDASTFALMFYYDIWQKPINDYQFPDIYEAIRTLNQYAVLVTEIIELVEYLLENLTHKTKQVDFHFPNILEIHARYSRDQILSAFNKSTPDRIFPSREGVIRLENANVEILLVTLEKSDKDFSPSTQYEDYAISENIFHWQSQNSTTPESPVGLSYIKHTEINKTLLLFVRERKKDSFDFTCPYYFLGPVSYRSHKGSKPMSINWELEQEMPAHLWHAAAKVAVG